MIRIRATIAIVMTTVSLNVNPGMFPAVSVPFVPFNIRGIAVLDISGSKIFNILGATDAFSNSAKEVDDVGDILAAFLE